MAISFYRIRGLTTYVIEDKEAGYRKEVELDDLLERVAYPIIYEKCWQLQTHNLGLDPLGRPLRDSPLPAEERALPASEKG